MNARLLHLIIIACALIATALQAGPAAHWVTRLDDDPRHPPAGSLRWSLSQAGPRIIKFAIAGTITLRAAIQVRDSNVTLDGHDAPGMGVCIRGGALEFIGGHDITLRYLRLRLGDRPGLRANLFPLRWRPKSSAGLDCLSLHECQRVHIDHCSFSWSCDELISVVRSQQVTIEWCLLSEPLGRWRLHPYGDDHAFALNASASSLIVRHCLFAHYVMRGPQFEANDTRRGDAWPVRMVATGNIMFDYQHSGSRATMGVEDHRDEAAGRHFAFEFSANRYLGAPKAKGAIMGTLKHELHPGVEVTLHSNESLEPKSKRVNGAVKDNGKPLHCDQVHCDHIAAPMPDLDHLLAQVGCSHHRDRVDTRIVSDVREQRCRPTIKSPSEVGGWPALDDR
jgi:hypothetical protein